MILAEKIEGKNHLEDLCVDRRVMLKWWQWMDWIHLVLVRKRW